MILLALNIPGWFSKGMVHVIRLDASIVCQLLQLEAPNRWGLAHKRPTKEHVYYYTQMIHVWNIYLHLPSMYGKMSANIPFSWILWCIYIYVHVCRLWLTLLKFNTRFVQGHWGGIPLQSKTHHPSDVLRPCSLVLCPSDVSISKVFLLFIQNICNI